MEVCFLKKIKNNSFKNFLKPSIFKLFLLVLLLQMVSNYEFTQSTNYKKRENYCIVHEDCRDLNFCVLNYCRHKAFYSITAKEIIGMILIFFAAGLANAGGTGGGGIVAPIMMLFLNFNSIEGIPISKMIIFAGALTALILNRNLRCPVNLNKTAIDFNIVILLLPSLLFGTTLGVIINQVLPVFVSYLILAIILAINFIKTINIGAAVREKELHRLNPSLTVSKAFYGRKNNSNRNMKLNEFESDDVSYVENEGQVKIELNEEESSLDDLRDTSVVNKLLISYELEKDKRRFPFYKIIFCLISLVILLMITLLKGSKSVHSIVNIENCSLMFWLVEFTYFPISIAITLNVAKLIKEEYEYRKTIGYKFAPSDIEWNQKNLSKFTLIGLSTGLLTGMLSISGGLILVPFLLNTGLNPVVASNTSTFVVVFESFSVMFQYSLLGKLNLDYGIIFSLISVVGSYIGTVSVQNYIAKTDRQSILIYIVAVCVCICFMIFTLNFVSYYSDIVTGEKMLEFSSPC